MIMMTKFNDEESRKSLQIPTKLLYDLFFITNRQFFNIVKDLEQLYNENAIQFYLTST